VFDDLEPSKYPIPNNLSYLLKSDVLQSSSADSVGREDQCKYPIPNNLSYLLKSDVL